MMAFDCLFASCSPQAGVPSKRLWMNTVTAQNGKTRYEDEDESKFFHTQQATQCKTEKSLEEKVEGRKSEMYEQLNWMSENVQDRFKSMPILLPLWLVVHIC